MPEPVTEPVIDGRRSRGLRTRQRIIDAAIDRFEADGFTGTSITSIASAAGVSTQTVYYAFDSKREILVAALDTVTAGDDAETPFGARSWVVEAIAAPDARTQVAQQVSGAATILDRSATLLDVVRSAAATDADIAAVWERNRSERRHAQLVFARALDARGALHPELSASLAADLALAATSPETWLLLRRDRGLSRADWVRWTTATLCGVLLGPGA